MEELKALAAALAARQISRAHIRGRRFVYAAPKAGNLLAIGTSRQPDDEGEASEYLIDLGAIRALAPVHRAGV